MNGTILTDGEKIDVIVAKGKITIDSNGVASVDGGTFGSTLDLFAGVYETRQNSASYRDEPSKLEKIAHYLNLLHDSLRVGHEVHKEIDEALKLFKTEAGI